jgi:hypothetical protein
MLTSAVEPNEKLRDVRSDIVHGHGNGSLACDEPDDARADTDAGRQEPTAPAPLDVEALWYQLIRTGMT